MIIVRYFNARNTCLKKWEFSLPDNTIISLYDDGNVFVNNQCLHEIDKSMLIDYIAQLEIHQLIEYGHDN